MKDKFIANYVNNLTKAIAQPAMLVCQELASWLLSAWKDARVVYICGNGGSAANAIHLANDFIYGAGKHNRRGIRVEALSANPAILTCLANDVGYDSIYAEQLKVKANAGDILIVLSGSGNSPNVIEALKTANSLAMKTCAILGFSGGHCKGIAQLPIHFSIDDMQIAEDLQLIVGHICMQWLAEQKFDNSTEDIT